MYPNLQVDLVRNVSDNVGYFLVGSVGRGVVESSLLSVNQQGCQDQELSSILADIEKGLKPQPLGGVSLLKTSFVVVSIFSMINTFFGPFRSFGELVRAPAAVVLGRGRLSSEKQFILGLGMVAVGLYYATRSKESAQQARKHDPRFERLHRAHKDLQAWQWRNHSCPTQQTPTPPPYSLVNEETTGSALYPLMNPTAPL